MTVDDLVEAIHERNLRRTQIEGGYPKDCLVTECGGLVETTGDEGHLVETKAYQVREILRLANNPTEEIRSYADELNECRSSYSDTNKQHDLLIAAKDCLEESLGD